MSEQLKHIFDISKCPTKRQMQEYLNGIMQPEEIYAFEHHISSCMLCSEAIDGMMEYEEAALTGMNELNDNFLKDHLESHPPHIHLNGIAAAADTEGKKATLINIWKPASIAAMLLLCLGLGWYFKNKPPQFAEHTTAVIAQATESNRDASLPASEKENVQTAPPHAVNSLTSSQNNTTGHSPSSPLAGADEAQPVATPPRQNQEKEIPVAATEHAENENLRNAMDNKQEGAKTEPANFKIAKDNTDTAAPPRGSYQQEKEQVTSATVKKEYEENKSKSEKKVEDANVNDPDILFENGEYAKALTAYKKQMSGTDAKSSAEAKLMAARCYLQLGQKKNAQKLLSELAEEGSGAPKRQAKKMLRELENEE